MTTTAPSTLPEWLAHCAALHPKTIDLSLERTVEVARRLGIRFTVPLVSVAGTNGKGSTCAMIESIAVQAGYRVGLYQKPELVHFQERCRLNGEAVDADDLVPHFAAVEAARGELQLTQFEFSTLAIARLLSQAPLDLVVLEVGMGGRFDSVNAFDADVAVIAPVYAAGEKPIEGINRDSYAEALRAHGHRNVITIEGEDDLAAAVAPYVKPGAAIIGTGAGSITGWMNNLPKKLEGLT